MSKMQYKCADKHVVKSLGEKKICEWLFSKGLRHSTELEFSRISYMWTDAGIVRDRKNKTPDFEVKAANGHIYYIEFFGYLKNYNYSESVRQKKAFYSMLQKKSAMNFIYLYPEDLDNLDVKLGFLASI